MLLVWNGDGIEAVDLDREIPGPRAEEVARLLEPAYLRGYLEGRRLEAGRATARRRGRSARGYRQIQRLLRTTWSPPPEEAPWRYAAFLREKILEKKEQAGTSAGTTSRKVVPETSAHPAEERS